MRLLGLSDLHVHHPGQAAALAAIPEHPDDWLIVAGDVTERPDALHATLAALVRSFARVVWVPGNHELWTVGDDASRGLARYQRMVDAARRAGAHTPEDGWIRWPGAGPERVIVPLFLLYDYTFAPDGMDAAAAVAWAAEDGIRAVDELLLHPDPFPTRAAWCDDRLTRAEALLATVPTSARTLLVNHWPLRRDLVRIPRVPRYLPWCGTRRTEDWHLRWRADLVVSGHLHVRATDWRDGTRFEEVSLGYPRQWDASRGAGAYLRDLLPSPWEPPPGGTAGPRWHR